MLEIENAVKRFEARSRRSWLNRAIATAARLERAWVLDVPISRNDVLTRVEGQVTPFNTRDVRRYSGQFNASNSAQFLYVPGRELNPRTFARRFETLLQVAELTPTTSRVSARFTGDYNWWLPGALMVGAMGAMVASPFVTSFGELAALFAVLSGATWTVVRSVCLYRINRFVESDRIAATDWLRAAQLGPYRTHPIASQDTTAGA